MQRYRVPDMSCGHCVQTITRALQSIDPAVQLSTDLQKHEVSVNSSADPEQVMQTLQQAGYPGEPLNAAQTR